LSCSKTGGGSGGDDSNHIPLDLSDTSLPVIVIDKPTTNQIFVNGDNIVIQGKVTDNSLYRGTIKIINDLNSLILFNQPYEIHGQPAYNFNVQYKTSVTSISNYTVIVEFEDHGLNLTTQTVKVKVNP
jgi:hypothetical protein